MTKKDYIVKIIKSDWSENAIVSAWNAVCEDNNDFDSMVEYMYDFDDMFGGKKPSEIAEMIEGCDFSCSDEYFTFNGYGNILSFSFLDDVNSPIDYDMIAEYLIENGDADTEEVDIDNLVEYFIDWFKAEYPDKDIEKVKYYFEEEDVDVDLLMDEWEDAADTIIYYLNGNTEDNS